MQRMQREYKIFWNDARLAKAKEIGMTPVEVAILASIVEEETAAVDEYPIVYILIACSVAFPFRRIRP